MNYTYKKVDIFEPSTNIKYADLITDTKLLKYAKHIFGDCVTNAFVLNKDDKRKVSSHLEDNKIVINNNITIIIEFNKINYVLFSNSEWASFEKLNINK